MNVHVYYRAAGDKLQCLEVTDVTGHGQALEMATEHLKGEIFAKKPYLALIKGGK